jgi:hypothetical protein
MQFAERMADLTGSQRLRLYPALAHYLSCQVRYFVLDNTLSESEKVGRMRAVNEILHLVTARTAGIREALPNARDWSEEEFGQGIERWATVHPEIREQLARAVDQSFREVTDGR